MKYKNLVLLVSFCVLSFTYSKSQTAYDEKYNLTYYTTSRNATAELLIKNGLGNSFTGILKIDGEERPVFGWRVVKKSEGGGFVYNTEGLTFYVQLDVDFQYQQLFKGIFNFDKTILIGNYFFYGNEFPFQGIKGSITQNKEISSNEDNILLFPNPVKDVLNIETVTTNFQAIEIYNLQGEKLIEKTDVKQISVANLGSGSYLLKVNKNNNTFSVYKFIKE